jgi:hypothetical protein
LGVEGHVLTKPKDIETLKSFVRSGLGCGCPEEVFSAVHIEKNPVGFHGLPIDYSVTIGGRLLIGFCLSQWLLNGMGPEIKKSLTVGKQLRDSAGLNRFRLVAVAKEPEKIAEMIEEQFFALRDLDERVHLHVVKLSAIPQFLLSEKECAGTVCETLK